MTDFISNLFANLPTLTMPRFGLSAVLDIAFITFVIYKALMWIRRTRAWMFFRGALTLLMVYLAASMLSMNATTELIQQGFIYVAFALMVIFAPELRKVLESLGKNRNIPFLSTLEDSREANSTQCVDEIIVAAREMSRVKTGALIVIEQQVPLGDLEGTGVAIDALVTSQLLINIFEHNTPLHDGAVLVRENRVKAATCILPLTTEHLSSDLGTRHRAAVGISEVSDAYAVVVSEESGYISIAKEGKLYRNLSENQIKDMLLENIKPSKSRKFRPGFKNKKGGK
ncbi:MAG: diadenylate cyclase CdaA [Defluviitaleaceae bacterium]|nr:diadenylate cyclase CdaA [Defluviitaleaceae bacterium]